MARVPDLEHRCRLEGFRTETGLKDVELTYPWPAFIQACNKIPFHVANPSEPSVFDGFAIVPTSGVLEAATISASTKSAMAKLGWLRARASTPAWQRKYKWTYDWLRGIQDLRERIAHLGAGLEAPDNVVPIGYGALPSLSLPGDSAWIKIDYIQSSADYVHSRYQATDQSDEWSVESSIEISRQFRCFCGLLSFSPQ